MDLSIVIVSWNTKVLLNDCLKSIYAALPPGEHEIWVVDNASTDGSSQMVVERFPKAHLLRNETNPGFGAANNQAIRQCSGRYILLLNPDTYVRTNALEILVDFMDMHPNAGVAGSKYLNPDNTLQRSCYPFPTLTRELWRLLHLDRFWLYGKYDQGKWDQVKPRAVDVLQGACLILRKEALHQVGLFDEDYFMYTEEVDLCYRFKEAGWLLYWVPSAEIIHYGGQSTQQMASEMFLSLYQTKLLFFRKHYGTAKALLYKLILLVISLFRLLLLPVALIARPSNRVENKKLARSYWRLLRKLPVM